MIEKQLRRYIMPNMLAMVGTSCYVLADTVFVAKAAGANGITALNLALPIYGLIFAIGSMIGIGSATRYSLKKALGNADADAFFSNSILWSLLLGVFLGIAGVMGTVPILRFMGADDTILAIGLPYMRIVFAMTPFFMLNYTFTAFVRNDDAPKIAMLATLTSGIFNIIFDYLFMFPMGMGMAGAALATGISPIVSMTVCMLHYCSKENHIRFVKQVPSLRLLAQACELGVVAFVGEIASGITTMVFNFILLDLAGNIGVAAYGVIANTALVGTALLNGVSQGLQPLASETYGKGEQEDEQRIYRHSLQIGIGVAILLVGIVCVFAKEIVHMFNSEQSVELAGYAVCGIRLYFLGFLVAAVNIVKAGFYSATGRGKESSMIAISRGVVAIVAFAFLLSKAWGVIGVWLAFLAAELFTLGLSICLGKQERRKKR